MISQSQLIEPPSNAIVDIWFESKTQEKLHALLKALLTLWYWLLLVAVQMLKSAAEAAPGP